MKRVILAIAIVAAFPGLFTIETPTAAFAPAGVETGFVTNEAGNSVSVFNTFTGAPLYPNIPVGNAPRQIIGVQVPFNQLYVANTGSNSISMIDMGTFTVVNTVVMPDMTVMGGMTLSQDQNFIFVAGRNGTLGEAGVWVLDLNTETPNYVAGINSGLAAADVEVVREDLFSGGGNLAPGMVYFSVPDPGAGQGFLGQIDLNPPGAAASIATPGQTLDPTEMARTPDDRRIVVACGTSGGTVPLIDLDSQTAGVQQINLGVAVGGASTIDVTMRPEAAPQQAYILCGGALADTVIRYDPVNMLEINRVGTGVPPNTTTITHIISPAAFTDRLYLGSTGAASPLFQVMDSPPGSPPTPNADWLSGANGPRYFTIEVVLPPAAAVTDGIFATNPSARVDVFNPTTGALMFDVDLGLGGTLQEGILAVPALQRVFVAHNTNPGTISVIDTSVNPPVFSRRITVPNSMEFRKLAVSADDNWLFIAGRNSVLGEAGVFQLDLSVIPEVPSYLGGVASTNHAQGIAVVREEMYTLGGGNVPGRVYFTDTAAPSQLVAIDLLPGPPTMQVVGEPFGIQDMKDLDLSPDQTTIFIGCQTTIPDEVPLVVVNTAAFPPVPTRVTVDAGQVGLNTTFDVKFRPDPPTSAYLIVELPSIPGTRLYQVDDVGALVSGPDPTGSPPRGESLFHFLDAGAGLDRILLGEDFAAGFAAQMLNSAVSPPPPIVDPTSLNGTPQQFAYAPIAGAPPVGPPAPSNLVATPGNNQVDLTWNASPGAVDYNVKRSTTMGGPYGTIMAGVAATNFTDNTAVNGTTYYYVVSGVNAVPLEGPNSLEASATPMAPPPPGLHRICPKGAPNAAGLPLIVEGLNFQAGAEVRIDGVLLPTTFVSPTRLNVTTTGTLPQLLMLDVEVRNPDAQTALLQGHFANFAPPGTMSIFPLTLPNLSTGYQLLSLPQFATVADLRTALETALGPYNPNIYRVFFRINNQYVELPNVGPNECLMGVSFWVLTRFGAQITVTAPEAEMNPATVQDRVIPLFPGWTMISLPFDNTGASLLWSDVNVTSDGSDLTSGTAANGSPGLMNPVLYARVGNQYVAATQMQAGEGYFVSNRTSGMLYLILNPTDVFKATVPPSYAPLPPGTATPPAPPAAAVGEASSSKSACGLGAEAVLFLLGWRAFHRLRRRRRLAS